MAAFPRFPLSLVVLYLLYDSTLHRLTDFRSALLCVFKNISTFFSLVKRIVFFFFNFVAFF